MRPLLTLWLLLPALGTRSLAAQGSGSVRARILQAEDRRAPTDADISLLRGSLRHRDAAVVLQSIRALGRLERPALAAALIPLLGHSSPRIRAQAAEALAQAAQGFRGDSSGSHRDAAWPALVAALSARVSEERDSLVRGALALSLGRLPYVTPEEMRSARENLLRLARPTAELPVASRDVARGLELLARATGRLVPLDSAFTSRLRALVASAPDEPTRRHALGALLVAQAADAGTVSLMLASSDPESRRLAVTGLAVFPAGAERDRLLGAAISDGAPRVRVEALRAAARLEGAAACPRLMEARNDRSPTVELMVIDLLADCPGDAAASEWYASNPAATWHRPAHGLLSLARAAPKRVRELLADPRLFPKFRSQWQSRMYAARAAGLARDTLTLLRYAADSVPNVREAAIAGLATVSGHAADSVYRAALSATDCQLLLSAATALAGSPGREAAARALLMALDRTTRKRQETSRDARVALLTRLHQLGDPRDSAAVLPYLTDFDSVIADSAAVTLTEWTRRPRHPSPRPLVPESVSLSEAEALRGKLFRFTIGQGLVDVTLNVDDAPVTVARLARLVRRGYFDGLTLHRVVPNFVLQGGSPGANEYAGDGSFMRDELGPRSHERGTFGVSTRGRDTGDGQIFVNLVDNPRLDYQYTVWGRVVSGMEVLDAVLEGEVIRRVEIRPR